MNSLGINEVKGSTKKHLWLKLETEFGDLLTFLTVNLCVYTCIMPDNFKKEVLAAEYVRLSSMVESLETGFCAF